MSASPSSRPACTRFKDIYAEASELTLLVAPRHTYSYGHDSAPNSPAMPELTRRRLQVRVQGGPDPTRSSSSAGRRCPPTPRAFKTHSQPGDGPGDFATFRDDMKYVVVVRNPEEAIVSFKPFLAAHSLELWKLWDAVDQREKMMRPTFEAFYNDLVLKGFPNMPPEAVPPGGLLTMLFFGFINGWWPLRHKKNVLLIHFNEMKNDHEGSVRKIAAHLGFEPTAEQWPKILEYTSFKWMKQNQRKFEIATLLPFKLLDEGGMVRKGAAGKAHEDGMTPEIAADIKKWSEMMVPDPEARKWLFQGGEIAPPPSRLPTLIIAAAVAALGAILVRRMLK